jgi:hypothetical protein
VRILATSWNCQAGFDVLALFDLGGVIGGGVNLVEPISLVYFQLFTRQSMFPVRRVLVHHLNFNIICVNGIGRYVNRGGKFLDF